MDAPRTIVITGISRGLGRALTRAFVAEGHRVAGCCRSAEAARQVQQESGESCDFRPLDVTHAQSVEAWHDALPENFRTPDLLINNAGVINRNNPLWRVPVDEFHQLLRVNIQGVFHVLRAFLPAMVERKRGVIVNFSSTWGRSTSPEVAPYCATKFAIEGLSQALADELPRGMACVPFNPGVIHTEMLESCFGHQASAFPDPESWAATAAPFLLGVGPKDNGQSLTAP